MKSWNYLILLCLPAMVVAGYLLRGWWNFLVPLCALLAFPVAKFFLSGAEDHAHANREHGLASYNFIALSFVPVLIGLTWWCLHVISKIETDAVSFCGLAFSLGIVNGALGFTLAHEFIHRFTKTGQAAGYLLLLQNNYMHYGIEHVRGHHVYACTPEDPHTARIGESVYGFLPRSVICMYRSAWKLEMKRLSKKGYQRPHLHNRMLLFGLLQIGLTSIIFFAFGFSALLFFLAQNVVAIVLQHIINYMQHYGLMRKMTSDGRYEKLNLHHAWNTGRSNSSLNLFHLENHSDHHMHPGLPFEKLIHKHDSPEHPAGYSFMVLLSLVPPLWFKIMNKRIPSHV